MFKASLRPTFRFVSLATSALALGLALTGCGSDDSSGGSEKGSGVNPAASAELPPRLRDEQKACNAKGKVYRMETIFSGVCSNIPLAGHECSRDGLWGALSPYRGFQAVMNDVDELLADGWMLHQCGRGRVAGADAVNGREYDDAVFLNFVKSSGAGGFSAFNAVVGISRVGVTRN